MALLFEERRQRYVSKQVKLVLELVDSDGKGGGDEGRTEDEIDRNDIGVDDKMSHAVANERLISPTESNINTNSSSNGSGNTVGDGNINSGNRGNNQCQ